MNYKIDKINTSEYPVIVEIWEASVRATHHFLKEEDINFIKPLLQNQYLKFVDLFGYRSKEDGLAGFLGVANQKVEMLFIHPKMRKKGVGKKLLQFAIENLNANKVDVNEENEQAVGFYEHMGFHTTGRSKLDSMGKPYPILHMELR